jgi:hypothetical protein
MIADWKCKDGMVRNRSPENCQEQFLLVWVSNFQDQVNERKFFILT